jgi:hypothetical protein
VFEVLKHSGSETKILSLDDTRARVEPYDAKSSAAAHGTGSQVLGLTIWTHKLATTVIVLRHLYT